MIFRRFLPLTLIITITSNTILSAARDTTEDHEETFRHECELREVHDMQKMLNIISASGMLLGAFIDTAIKLYNTDTLKKDYAKRLHPIQTTLRQQYPAAIRYVEQELIKEGIPPQNLLLQNCSFDNGEAFSNTLSLPLHDLQKAKGFFSPIYNFFHPTVLPIIQGTIAHEIGHICNNDNSCHKRVVYPLLAGGIVSLITYFVPYWSATTWVNAIEFGARTVAQAASAKLITNALYHLEEYRADSAEIKRFAHEPKVLTAESAFYADLHKQKLATNLNDTPWLTKKLARLPWFWQLFYLCHDTHPSALSRAVRFAQAAGQKITQAELARTTYTKVIKERNSRPVLRDFDQILLSSL